MTARVTARLKLWPYRNYRHLLEDCLELGEVAPSRLGDTKELRGVTFAVSPGDVVYRPKISEPLMWCEMLQLLGGIFDPEALKRAAPSANHSFFTAQMAYGPRVAPQLPAVAELLRNDPSSRRAIILLPDKGEDEPPCTVMMQFFIRQGRLEMHVMMRSWDLWLGLPYDIIMFGGLARAMATYLNVPCGQLEIYAASAHLYQKHWTIDPARVENIPGFFRLLFKANYSWNHGHYWESLAASAVSSLRSCPWQGSSPAMVERAFALRGSSLSPAGVRGVDPMYQASFAV